VAAEWRAIVVLAGFTGLRVQPEAPILTWTDIDEENGGFVYNPKTKKSRQVPLFPAVSSAFEDLRAVNGEDEFLFSSLRRISNNWRTPLAKMIRRAGIEPWPLLFNSLRSCAAIDILRE